MKCKLNSCNSDILKPGRLYCCNECSKVGQVLSRSLIMDEIKQKRKQTNLLRYGVENTGQSVILREKYKTTNKIKFGVENPLSNIEVRNKAEQTNLLKYNDIHPTKTQIIKIKTKETNLEKYGVDVASKSELVKDKTRNTNILRYGDISHTRNHLSSESKLKLEDAEWLKNSHHAELKPIYLIAQELGISKSQLGKIYSKNDIDILHHKKSVGEIEVASYISTLTSYQIKTNVRNIINGELDIYIPELNFAIEFNGAYWHSQIAGTKQKEYHLVKTQQCFENGIHLMHIFDFEWICKKDIIKSMIGSKFGLSERIYARSGEIRQIDTATEKLFLHNNHLQGYIKSSVCYGLFVKDILVSVMSFGKSRFSKIQEWELLRFSNKLNINVLGGASRLMKHFVKLNAPTGIISYSHKDKFTGHLYKQLGFNFSHSSPPSYHYTNDYKNFENRMRYQKHKLEKLLLIYDSALTEWQNMQNNGYDRIWDCGNDVWIWNSL